MRRLHWFLLRTAVKDMSRYERLTLTHKEFRISTNEWRHFRTFLDNVRRATIPDKFFAAINRRAVITHERPIPEIARHNGEDFVTFSGGGSTPRAQFAIEVR